MNPFSGNPEGLNNGSALAPKYPLPGFLVGTVSQIDYEKWLIVKSYGLYQRDKARKCSCALAATQQAYKQKIHDAVLQTAGPTRTRAKRSGGTFFTSGPLTP
jgi:hypothetical protein